MRFAVVQNQLPTFRIGRPLANFDVETEGFVIGVRIVEMNPVKDEELGQIRPLDLMLDKIGVVPDVSSLRRDCDALMIVGTLRGVQLQRRLRIRFVTHVQQKGANHQARSSLARLTMDGHDIMVVLMEPIGSILAKLVNEFEIWRVVIAEEIVFHPVMKHSLVVHGTLPFLAKVIDLVVIFVS